MSGHKRATVSLSQEDYERLYQAERRLHNLEREMDARLDASRQEVAAALSERLQQAQQRQTEYQALVANLGTQVQALESRTAQMILAQQSELIGALESFQGSLLTGLTQFLDQELDRLQAEIDAEQQQRNQQFSHLEAEINALAGDQQRKIRLASAWVQAGAGILDFIDRSYDHERFAPTRLAPLRLEVEQARANLEQNLPEAALATVQRAYQQLSALRTDLEQAETEWEALRAAFLQAAQSLLEITLENQFCQAIDLDGRQLGFELDANAWSGGALEALVNEIAYLIAAVEGDDPPQSTADLRRLLDEVLPELHRRLEGLIFLARATLVNSQLRINVADVVVRALETQGFVLQESGYRDGDMLHDYQARVRSLDGSEVVVQIMPIPGVPGQNELHLHSHDRLQRSEHELRQRAREISNLLRQYGLLVGGVSVLPSTEVFDENNRPHPTGVAPDIRRALPGPLRSRH